VIGWLTFGIARTAADSPERGLSRCCELVRRVLWRGVGNKYIRSDALTEKDIVTHLMIYHLIYTYEDDEKEIMFY